MNIFKQPLMLVSVIVFFNVAALPCLSVAASTRSADPCSRARNDYLAAEQEWSSTNAEVAFLRQELERLRDLRWQTKATVSVLDEANRILAEKGSLSIEERMTLNARIPEDGGKINSDGTFRLNDSETAPLREARSVLGHILSWSDENIEKTETELKEKEGKSHQLIQRLAEMEAVVEKECRAAGGLTPWEQGLPRTSAEGIYQRYVDRERRRQQEVESRRWADLERFWLKRHYYRRPFWPCRPYDPCYRYNPLSPYQYYPYRHPVPDYYMSSPYSPYYP
ncbi:MAG: hypothetical protein JRJ12_14330 [Deltaproteobacteria bacterium]|nr:hypothetical protein [Deltaproteobacteria bacterium]MBW2072328.1 hypothetical protein [Deltaproteobacteria bacterium]